MLPKLEIHSHKDLLPQVLADLELAYECIKDAPDYSVALAKNGRIVAHIRGATSPIEACLRAAMELRDHYRTRGWIRPWQNVVAVESFAPLGGRETLAAAGVDAVLALTRIPAYRMVDDRPTPGEERYVIDSWLKVYKQEKDFVLKNDLRAIMFPKEDLTGLKNK